MPIRINVNDDSTEYNDLLGSYYYYISNMYQNIWIYTRLRGDSRLMSNRPCHSETSDPRFM